MGAKWATLARYHHTNSIQYAFVRSSINFKLKLLQSRFAVRSPLRICRTYLPCLCWGEYVIAPQCDLCVELTVIAEGYITRHIWSPLNSVHQL